MNDDQTTINGDFYLLTPANNKEQKWGLRANDVTIDGLSFPKFTWEWIGINLATGVLIGIGGQLFAALTSAIFGGTGQSLEQLLKAQLEAFARIVQQAITDNEIQRYTSLMESCFTRFKEISRNPNDVRLGRLLDDTSDHLTELGNLGFPAYRTYMSGASLRLAALQEGIKRHLAGAADFEDQMNASIAKHHEMIAYIEKQTDPNTYVDPNTTQNLFYHCYANGIEYNCNQGIQMPTGPRSWYFRAIDFDKVILGVELKGYLPFTVGMPPETKPRVHTPEEIVRDKQLVARDWQWLADRLTDFAWLRQKLKAENTDLGEKMVQKWMPALEKLKSTPTKRRFSSADDELADIPTPE